MYPIFIAIYILTILTFYPLLVTNMVVKHSLIPLVGLALLCSHLGAPADLTAQADPADAGRARLNSSASVSSPIVSSPEVVDMIVASVDGQPILLSELRAALKEKGNDLGSEADIFSNDSIRTLKEIVQNRILQAESQSAGIVVSEQDIDAYQEEVRARSGLPRDQFLAEMKRQGLPLDEYRKQIRNQILQARVVSARIRSKLAVTDSDVEKYVKEFPERKPRAGEIRLIEIDIPTTIAEPEGEFNRVKRAIEGGHKPQEVAKQYFSDLGYVDPSQLREEYAAVVQNLAIGRISKPIFTENSIHAFYVAGKADENGMDPALKKEIRDYLIEKTYQKEADRYLREELPKAHDVEILIEK